MTIAGCTGDIAGQGGEGDPALPADPGLPLRPGTVTPGPGAPSNPGANTPGPGVVTPPPAPGDPAAAGPMPLRRLTRREYNNTVRELLGDTTRPADMFPPDSDETFLFRRAGLVSLQDATVLRSAAETLAAAAVKKLGTLLPCDPAAGGEAPCARQFVEGFGLRAYRRPLASAELERHLALYNTARATLKLPFADAIGLVIEAMLQAPAFLYHWESTPGAPAAREAGLIRLGHYEVASRLSYFVWGSMPDKDLFAAAAAGKLGTAAEVEAQARRMLGDPKARETIAAFFDEWLDLDALHEKPKDAKVYPMYDDALKAAMGAETRAFVQHVVFDGDGRWATLLGSTYSFVNQALGGVYGMTAVKGTNLQRTDLNPMQRRGFLTHASFLALTGATDGSHPVKRGMEVFQRMLCRVLPPPPPDVPPAAAAAAGVTTRQRFAEHSKQDCARACHNLIDPIGFAFEHYDGIGRYRTMDNGRPVDASGAIPLDGAPKPFANALDLIGHLAASEEARRCFATQLTRFALGRAEADEDRASLDQVGGVFVRGDATVKDLVAAIAATRSFRYRAPAAGEVLP